jgi:hypothetical protein
LIQIGHNLAENSEFLTLVREFAAQASEQRFPPSLIADPSIGSREPLRIVQQILQRVRAENTLLNRFAGLQRFA